VTQTFELLDPTPEALVKGVVARGAARGASPALPSVQLDVQWLAGKLSRAALGEWLRTRNAARRYDAHTILRALGPDVGTLAVEAAKTRTKARHDITLVVSVEQRADSPVICLDVVALGGVNEAQRWIDLTWEGRRDRSKTILVAAVGREGEDLSKLGRLVDGIVVRPAQDGRDAWEKSLAPVLKGLREPDYADSLPSTQTQGGVTAEEFAETIAQARLQDADPRKRD
jgi:hypothetical protein